MQFIWLIFTGTFVCLASFHFFLAKTTIKRVDNQARVKTINGQNLGIAEFINDFNHYIDKQNNSNRLINILQSIGYGLAAATAFFSFFLSF